MNILILSVGTRNKIVQYFKNELKGDGKVVATDASKLAPALYEADRHYVVPRIDEPNYLERILDICNKESIDGVLSLIDPELLLLSRNKKSFLNIGVTPIISSKEVIELSFNKYEFSKCLEKLGVNTVKTYRTYEQFYTDFQQGKIDFPVFVKPITGSASININVIHNLKQLKILTSNEEDLIIQEYMDGTEYGVDVYLDLLSHRPTSIFMKEKLLMRAGETDKSVSVTDESLLNVVKDFIGKIQYSGIIDIDIFKKNNRYYISEVNPRFGGGYPHAYECGINIPLQIINNLKGITNNPQFEYKSGIYMMKYNELHITGRND